MNNDACLTEGNVVEPEVVEQQPVIKKNLITVMVLSITLAHQILGKNAPKNGKLAPGQGKLVVQAIEKAVKKTFPDTAPMILGLFGIEMMGLMPFINKPDEVVAEMIAEYSNTILAPNANSSTQPNME
jgi:hypothetical protein